MVVVGFAGQGLFAMRFILQWLTSEGQGRSVIPVAFWYFSIGGGSVLLLYAIWRQDPVIICGQGLGLFIYFRNLYILFTGLKAVINPFRNSWEMATLNNWSLAISGLGLVHDDCPMFGDTGVTDNRDWRTNAIS